ncbi:hypothetical protein L1887_15061 [Cichorium endivia]|nr:hypothetical protein L1887_15061 [Cichorium endivia]
MKSIGNPHQRVDERTRTGKPLSRATIEVVEAKLLNQAHLYVLRNTSVVEPYIVLKNVWLMGKIFVTMFVGWLKGLQSIGTKWKNFKHYLYKNFIQKYKNDLEVNMLNPPSMYPFLKKEDWKLFVAQRLSKKWEEKSENAKEVRKHNKYNHRLSRKGYAKLTVEIMEETGMTEEEIGRALLWRKGREMKKGGYAPNVKMVVDRMLSGATITCYMMNIYEEIKNGTKRDRGICFVSPTAISPAGRQAKDKSKNTEEASRSIANRLSTRKDNDIILLPFNPGKHWVLAVLDMKTTTCYYIDSLRPSNVNPHLRQIIDAAMVLYAAQSGSNKRVKLNWVNATCPRQPGNTECGYYTLKFMKEIVEEGVEVLIDNNVGSGKVHYTDADIDEIREEWASFVTNFIFR